LTLIISYTDIKDSALLSALNLFPNGDELIFIFKSIIISIVISIVVMHSNIDNSYILYFSDDIFPLTGTPWRGKRAQYSEDIHKKNSFSQISKNFLIYLNDRSK